jgi:transposase-like protein
VSTTGLVDAKQQAGATKRRQYSEALKCQMVAETQAPGASVSIVARRHDVNSNQLFRWRRQLCQRRWSKAAQWCRSRLRPMAVDRMAVGRGGRIMRASSRSRLVVGHGPSSCSAGRLE